MPKKHDRAIIDYVHQLIATGYTEDMMGRRIVENKGVNRDTARKYIGLAFGELRNTVSKDRRGDAFLKAEVMIATDRAMCLKKGDMVGAGRCVDRFMSLHGLDKFEVTVSGLIEQEHRHTVNIADMTSEQQRKRLRELVEKAKGVIGK